MLSSILCSVIKNKVYTAVTMCSEAASTNNWRGVPLSEMYGSQSPWGAPEFPLVSPGHKHAVLYHIPSSGIFMGDRPPKPQIGKNRWDSEHVKMPCSSHNLYPVTDSSGESRLEKRWELIEAALSKPIHTSQELANTILSYNSKFKKVWKFCALHKLFNDYLEEEESQYFFDVTLPEIAKLALALPKLIQSPIPLLKQHKNQSVSLSQQQISCLLANAFFCTFPRRNTTKRNTEYYYYPLINFSRLYEMKPSNDIMEKFKCICHYFRRVCTKVPIGVTTFSRHSVVPDGVPSWSTSTVQIASLPLHVDPENTIEGADGLVQIDFANQYVGGGVLGLGCVQEEIRFVICPEMLVSMLFTEVLRSKEALMMIGCERYSMYSGYSRTFHWTGDFVDQTPFDSSQRRRVAVLAIDALPYTNAKHEYVKDSIHRDITKAWVGFSCGTDPDSASLNYPGVATGNWGCGAFGGSPQLKSLLQMMACAQAKRPMAYYTFKDYEIRDDVNGIYNLLARYNVTVGKLYKLIMQFSETDVQYADLHAYIHQKLRDEVTKPPHDPDETDGICIKTETLNCLSPDTLKEFQDSPDLFSQDEVDESVTEVTVKRNDSPDPSSSKETKEPNNSRLLEQMQKLDEQSGMLNLSVNRSSFKVCDENVTKGTSNTHSDATNDMKKRLSKKITDYFTKKPQ